MDNLLASSSDIVGRAKNTISINNEYSALIVLVVFILTCFSHKLIKHYAGMLNNVWSRAAIILVILCLCMSPQPAVGFALLLWLIVSIHCLNDLQNSECACINKSEASFIQSGEDAVRNFSSSSISSLKQIGHDLGSLIDDESQDEPSGAGSGSHDSESQFADF